MAELKLLGLLSAHIALTALPGIAASLYAAYRGIERQAVLLAIGLATTGVIALLAFWAFYANPVIGEVCSFLVLFGSLAVSAFVLFGGRRPNPMLLRQLGIPLVLWAFGSAFILFLGFMHGGSDTALATSANRFSGMLPSDNDIPRFFAEWLFVEGHHGSLPVYPPDWLSSDRPPLQIGYVLTQRSFGWDAGGLNYQVLGVVLQQLWIVGLWALLSAAGVGRITRALAMVTVLVSDVAIVNGFYVWPKMLPTAMMLAVAALVLTPLWSDLRRDWRASMLIATLVALAMLGHGSSVFAFIPLALVAAVRGLPSIRWVAVATATGVVLMGSWSAYQRYVDPPGDRLTKWMLAGRVAIDSEGTLEAVIDSYGDAGIGGVLHNKAENFVSMVGGGPAVDRAEDAIDAVGFGQLDVAVSKVREILFFYLLPSFGLLLLAPLLMLLAGRRRGRGPPEWSFALSCFLVVGIGAVAWGLLLFGTQPARTIIHAGSYVLPILGFCGAVAGLRAVFPHFAIWYVGIAAALMLAVYVPALNPPPNTSYSLLAIVLTAASLAGFCLMAFRRVAEEPVPADSTGC